MEDAVVVDLYFRGVAGTLLVAWRSDPAGLERKKSIDSQQNGVYVSPPLDCHPLGNEGLPIATVAQAVALHGRHHAALLVGARLDPAREFQHSPGLVRREVT